MLTFGLINTKHLTLNHLKIGVRTTLRYASIPGTDCVRGFLHPGILGSLLKN